MSTLQVQSNTENANTLSGELMEKVVIQNDLSALNPKERTMYIMQMCKSLGLNPLTKPFELIKFQGKLIPYARKECTEQLRKLNDVSVRITKNEKVGEDLYVVTAEAKLPSGRFDSSTGAICMKGLRGDALANAVMKAETKAKRRVTMSICGLGMLDESELDTMRGAQRVAIDEEPSPVVKISQKKSDPYAGAPDVDLPDVGVTTLAQDIKKLKKAKDLVDLKALYQVIYTKYRNIDDAESLEEVIKVKDELRKTLQPSEKTEE